MGTFGWSYPPGVSSLPDDEPCFCEICNGDVDASDSNNNRCICPECPECGEVGNPDCYKVPPYPQSGFSATELDRKPHMQLSYIQWLIKSLRDRAWEEEGRRIAEAEAEMARQEQNLEY